MAECWSCRAGIIFRTHPATGRRNPIDPAPAANGNLRLRPDGTYETLTGRALQEARERGDPLYLSHFVTCPDAERFRAERPRASLMSTEDDW